LDEACKKNSVIFIHVDFQYKVMKNLDWVMCMLEKLKKLMTLKMGKENRPDIEVFTQNINSVKNWWKYFGGKPNLEGLKILEIGCGWGSLCIDAALSKAKKKEGCWFRY